MKYYPINLDINNRKCLVVGGGAVATRKVRTLLDCGALVTVISPEATRDLVLLEEKRKIEIKKRTFTSSDLDGVFLVIGATDDEELNRRIGSDARQLNILCNIVDLPDACNFILPAVINRGDLVISVSTSGTSPAFARMLRKDLEKEFGEEYAEFLRLMGAIRKKLLFEKHEPEAHRDQFERLIDSGLFEMIKNRKKDDINSLLVKVLGAGYGFEELIDLDK